MRMVGFRGFAVGVAFLLAYIAQTQTSAQAASSTYLSAGKLAYLNKGFTTLGKDAQDMAAACQAEIEALPSNSSFGGLVTSAHYISLYPRKQLEEELAFSEKNPNGRDPTAINAGFIQLQMKINICLYKRRLAQLDGTVLNASASSGPAANTASASRSLRGSQANAQMATPASAQSGLSKEASDLIAACRAEIDAFANDEMAQNPTMARTVALAGPTRAATAIAEPKQRDALLVFIDRQEKNFYGTPPSKNKADLCMMRRRLAQLDGKANVGGSSRGNQANAQGIPSQQGRAAVVPSPERSNSANDATHCVELIGRNDFAAKGVKTIMLAVLRNNCPYDISVTWCIVGSDCKPGYSNLWDIKANKDWGISVPASDQRLQAKWAACKKDSGGFIRGQGELSRKLKFACQ